MLSIVLVISISSILIFAISKMLKKKPIVIKGQISGIVISKLTGKGQEGVKLYLGTLENSNKGSHSFKPEENMSTLTDNEGFFDMKDIQLKSYWIMAEYKGKKALKLIKLDINNTNIENIVFKI